jgi:lantibiotic modifying enzyme
LSLPVIDDDVTRAEIATAVDTTLHACMGVTHTLCHGDLGNLLIVDLCARVLSRPDWKERADCELARVLEELESGEPRCGGPSGREAPGLLNGIAGVGYGLLYLGWPGRLPLVLGLG